MTHHLQIVISFSKVPHKYNRETWNVHALYMPCLKLSSIPNCRQISNGFTSSVQHIDAPASNEIV
uniref:Uncharacterized protein n=1 Tax=Arundo donax TaxID=35708 RepID=A0A0A9A5Y0_ARUDO